MKKYRNTLFCVSPLIIALYVICVGFFSCAPQPQEENEVMSEVVFDKTVEVSGIVTSSTDTKTAEKNSKAIEDAIKSADKNTAILLPDGVIAFCGPLDIKNKTNIAIRGGKDTELLNVSYDSMKYSGEKANVFKIRDSSNIFIENIAVDFLAHTTADGVITEIKNGRTYFEIYPEFVSGDKKPIVGGETVYSVLTADDTVFLDERWPEGGSTVLKKESESIFSVPMEIGKVGHRICCRISCGSVASPAIFVNRTQGLYLDGITCYSCPSAFIYAPYGNADFEFSNLNIRVREGSKALLASDEDCIHAKHLKGKLTVTDSTFYGIGDDALNSHTKLCVVESVDENTLTCVVGGDNSTPDNGIFNEGDTVEIIGRNYKSLGTAVVVKQNGKTLKLDSVPENTKNGCFVQNITYSPTVTFKNCKVGFGRARGVLLQAKNATVEGCTFENLRLAAVLAAPDFEYWYEGGFTDNLTVKGNVFRNCTNYVKDYGFAVVHVNSSHDEVQNKANVEGHKNVTVVENTFEGCEGRLVRATSTVNFVTDVR
ncbi:MAG: hypothetical protein IKU43_01795 [Clostridia bacterium]|nr:hypothetical protein [Clostridia bacterium]